MRATLARPARRLAATLGAASALALTLAAPPAQAGSQNWDCSLAAYSSCIGPAHALRSSAIYSPINLPVAAAASPSARDTDLYGGWMLGVGYICHPYNGSRTLYPVVRNNSPVSSWFVVASTFGAGAETC
ncbi:hypothetical protein ACVU7I_10960 [Patulibacter sp. S7RM1-6]